MEGPCSSATVANFMTRCAARRPICAVFALPWQLKEVQNCSRKREISARRGSRTRRGGTVMPLRGSPFKKKMPKIDTLDALDDEMASILNTL